MGKIWQIKDRPSTLKLDENEVIEAIKNGLLKGDDILVNIEYRFEVAIKDCLYSIYLNEEKDAKD